MIAWYDRVQRRRDLGALDEAQLERIAERAAVLGDTETERLADEAMASETTAELVLAIVHGDERYDGVCDVR